MKKYVELLVEVIVTTNKAVKVKIDGGDEVWIPWSVIEDNDEDFQEGYEGKMYVEEWFCQKELME